MKLRTSYFNGTVLRKDITRFAPVWGLYTVFTLMVLFLFWSNDSTPARFANNASDIMQAMGTVNFFYAGICAVLLFGDLFTTRMCNALHAFPLRREGWFLTHCVAGFLFCLVPNTLAALLCALLLQQYFWMAFVWLGLMVLQFLFFFGVGVFAAVSAGNRLGSIAIYGIINFLAVILAWLVMTFYEPFLYGIELDMEQFVWFSPIVQFASSEYVITDYPKVPTKLIFKGFVPIDWWFVCIAAAFGAVFLLLAVQIYRKRKLENAGDFISLHPMRPVFLITYTLCVGAAMYFISDVIAESAKYVFLVIGFAIGFFTGKMLLERKVNVFKGKSILAFGALLAAFAISIGLTWLDPLGITRYIPDTADIQWMQVHNSSDSNAYYQDSPSFTITDRSEIDTYRDLHRKLIDDREVGTHYALCDVQIRYQLTSGATVTRYYTVPKNSTLVPTLQTYFSDWRYVFQTDDWDSLTSSVTYVTIDRYYNDNEDGNNYDSYALTERAEFLQLLEAIKQDCQAGTMAQDWDFHQDVNTEAWLYLDFLYEGTAYRMDLTVYSDCANTLAFLNSYNPAK